MAGAGGNRVGAVGAGGVTAAGTGGGAGGVTGRITGRVPTAGASAATRTGAAGPDAEEGPGADQPERPDPQNRAERAGSEPTQPPGNGSGVPPNA